MCANLLSQQYIYKYQKWERWEENQAINYERKLILYLNM